MNKAKHIPISCSGSTASGRLQASFRNESKDQGGERVDSRQNSGRDVQRKTKKLVQSQNYTEYTSVAHKIHKCMNKVEVPREPVELPGSLLGHSSLATKFKAFGTNAGWK